MQDTTTDTADARRAGRGRATAPLAVGPGEGAWPGGTGPTPFGSVRGAAR